MDLLLLRDPVFVKRMSDTFISNNKELTVCYFLKFSLDFTMVQDLTDLFHGITQYF